MTATKTKLTTTPTKGRLTYKINLTWHQVSEKPLIANGTFSLEDGAILVHDGDKSRRFTDAASVIAFELYPTRS
jgi:hypothetical protein